MPLTVILTLLGSAAALAITNPNLQDYQAHAGEQLVGLATDELCGQRGLPMLLRVWVKNCPALIADQQPSLAALAGQMTTRTNLGLLSVFSTKVGGQQLLLGWRLPRYTVTTLGVAGHFITINTRSDQADDQ